MQPTGVDIIMSFVPFFLLTSIPFAIGAAYLAPKMGRNRSLWAILFLIPIANFFMMYVFMFVVAGAVLDRLNALGERTRNVVPSA